MGGVVFSYTGRYDFAWAALLVIGAIAFTLQWTMDDRPPGRRESGPISSAASPAA
jgi:hypothetical protein